MDTILLALILGFVGSAVYYLDQTFIQKQKADMTTGFKVFVFTAGIVFVTSMFLDETISPSGILASESGVTPASRIATNQEMMTGNAPF
jgi:uncharacterized membrane-anchored protein